MSLSKKSVKKIECTFKFNLNDHVSVAPAGIKGVITGRAEYLFENNRYGVQPPNNKDGDPQKEIWAGESALSLEGDTGGGG